MINKIYNEPCQETVKRMLQHDIKVDMVITSPPYWGLRSFAGSTMIWDGDNSCEHDFTEKINPKHNNRGGSKNKDYNRKIHVNNSESYFCNKCGAWKGQLGLEPNFNDFITHLCDIFDEIGTCIKDTGSLWVNLGDTYSTVSGRMRAEHSVPWPGDEAASQQMNFKQPKTDLADKCLVGIPERFMVAMIDRGWILRNKIIWYKRNPMPSSATDRFTVDFENLYWFVKKSRGYYFDQQLEPFKSSRYNITHPRNKGAEKYAQAAYGEVQAPIGEGERDWYRKGKRNKRCVWDIPTKSNPYAHFATYPEELIVTPIKACCPVRGIVYDPCMGSGTTAVVADKNDRYYIGSESVKGNCDIIEKRLIDATRQGRLAL